MMRRDSMAALVEELREAGMRMPDFGNSNLEVARELLRADSGKLIGRRRNKVVMIIDGMGRDLASRVLYGNGSASGYAKWLNMRPITTVFPSTTINALSSFYSGEAPASHGVIATKIPFKEAGMIVNTLAFSAGIDTNMRLRYVDPRGLYARPRTIEALSRRGGFTSLMHEAILGTGLSSTAFVKEEMVPFVSFDDMFLAAARLVKKRVRHIFVYYDLVDHEQHVYSPAVEEPRAALHSIFASMHRLLRPVLEDSDYDFIITADHGQVSIEHRNTTQIHPDDELMGLLSNAPWGERRALFMSVEDGKEARFEDYAGRAFGKRAIVVRSDEAIRSGLFGGRPPDALRYRFGTHMVLPRNGYAIHYNYPGSLGTHGNLGGHGGLSSDEMEVPLLTNF